MAGMKLEMLPVILGVIVCLLGIGICFVAFQPESLAPVRERRRRMRAEPNPTGQLLLGLGTICMGAALMGRDTWRFSNIVVFTGIALIVVGGSMNRQFLRELILFRGAARRSENGNTRDRK